jgi:Prenyltransferase and squalene oxidase repeat
MAPVEVEFSPVPSPNEAEFVSSIALPFLQAAQNDDGGWGFRAGSRSRVEATSWALLALRGPDSTTEIQQLGFRFLRAMQLPDGSWPSAAAQNVGCWATSLAAWALLADPESRTAVAAALRWICDDWPRDSSFIMRMIRKIAATSQVTSQNHSLRGWGWTPRTASWVEPTAFALIALDQAPKDLLPDSASRRRELARALICDRMCPGGGWNCGNPMVYGVPGDPLVEATVWALLALRDEPNRRESVMSLAWIEKNVTAGLGPGSLALARICLGVHGRAWPAIAPKLEGLYETNEFLENVPVMAWTCLALSPRKGWLGARAEGRADAVR